MKVVFIGGNLDGQLREVPEGMRIGSCDDAGSFYTTQPHTYALANGIARHESVSEEEVARRVAKAFEAAERWELEKTNWRGE